MPSMHGSEHRRRFLTGLAALLLALMAALHLAQTKVRVDAKAKEEEGARPKARGRSYEAHVLSRENLPADVAVAGGRLQTHPVIRPAQVELEGAYFTQPKGFADGKATPVEGFAHAPATWRALGRGGYRIPDAIIHEAGGGETLVEIKCPSPWLVFDEQSKSFVPSARPSTGGTRAARGQAGCRWRSARKLWRSRPGRPRVPSARCATCSAASCRPGRLPSWLMWASSAA